MIDLLLPTVSQGLLWSLLALGVYITFRVLDIADLTVEGSFPLGASVAVTLLVKDVNPVTAILAAALAGGLAGVVTGLLHTKLRIPALLAGILTMIALYSVNLRIMGKANVSLLGKETAFTLVESTLGVAYSQAVLLVGILSCLLFSVLMYWFFGTEIGAAIRATGYNPQMIRAQGVDTNIMLLIGLFFSNALVAVAGALVAQSNGFADVGMGVGTIVIGLASVIIGEVLFGTRSFKNSLISVILGSIVYRLVIAIVLQMGMPPNDLKLFTAVLVAIALSLPMVKGKFQSRKAGI
ncbi:ABC transporter permease [Acidaminococcus fermentans]|uniref:Inner-membrane translocator n=2 Tax=Acidaminococcus fermentans TaxID=905 RepID=D2RLN9_ACIFV|nr:ABC transporter permease [Acidaminococcus fermentans]ADB47991.1 inner-membrane translocator [Acidaminococcus fermentans DSM 20731]MCF0139134.1 ABC transporter permease [Acidaminococcus fermentans]MCI6285482.1 ABC transporter permease [Acidaminococcus fermentans]MDD7195157.1 ABC transporter permease [Acidaminococcus fermentans]MDY2852703.1 ABC transporter permease [Acidaminococcus fermentans]